jgi:hypothetical protein
MNEHSANRLQPFAAVAALLAICLLLGGCASLKGDMSGRPGANVSGADRSSQRARLNAGYSALYSAADGLAKVDKIFYLKVESDDVQRVVQHVTGYSGELARRLETLTEDFPALAIDRDVTPPIIEAAHEAQKKATLERFAPVAGESGKAFERGILIRLLGVVDQQHYLAATLAEREPDPALAEIMANAGRRYAGFYDEIDGLMRERFYR